jgi:cytochrome c peroxidase
MPIPAAVYSPWQFWDGRADSLWAQALGPVENPAEHGSARVQIAQRLIENYATEYRALFGSLPGLSDQRRFPEQATPLGNDAAKAAWDAMAPHDRDLVNQVFANFGKSVAAFERTIPLPRTRFDTYVAAVLDGRGDDASLSPAERDGLRLFVGKGRCVQCHSGPLLTNHEFANTGVPARAGLSEDNGRSQGVLKALADPFNCRGAFSDMRDKCEELEFATTEGPELMRAYKVPSLRGVAARAPYMHAGQFRTLAEVVAHYDRAPAAPRGMTRLQPLHFTADERQKIEAFLRSLDAIP